jgi:hypothetical protein
MRAGSHLIKNFHLKNNEPMAQNKSPMDKEKIVPTEPTAEELEAEKKELEEVKEDELRDKVAEELGIDPDDQPELLDKIVSQRVEHQKKLSEAIGQKINWRKKALESPKPEATPKETEKVDVKSEIMSVLEEQRLEDMSLPEELKQEVKKIAKLNNISVKKAAEDPYIQYRKQELESAAKAEEATISRTNKGKTVKFDLESPPSCDRSPEDGRKGWDEWKAFVKPQGK